MEEEEEPRRDMCMCVVMKTPSREKKKESKKSWTQGQGQRTVGTRGMRIPYSLDESNLCKVGEMVGEFYYIKFTLTTLYSTHDREA